MVDIHQHLIYGVDDGASSLEMALAMANDAAEDGITHIVCTPHASDEFPFQPQIAMERFRELQQKLNGVVELSLGCEFHLNAENIQDALKNPLRYSINGLGYLLVEFPSMVLPPQTSNHLALLQEKGNTIIIAHPERYPALLRHPELLEGFIRQGCLLQVTASSLYGRFGRAAEAFSNQLLELNWIHFLATDAHHPQWRPAHLQKAFDYVVQKKGVEAGIRLCTTNPRAVIEGKHLQEQPEPISLDSLVQKKINRLQGKASMGKMRSLLHKLFDSEI